MTITHATATFLAGKSRRRGLAVLATIAALALAGWRLQKRLRPSAASESRGRAARAGAGDLVSRPDRQHRAVQIRDIWSRASRAIWNRSIIRMAPRSRRERSSSASSATSIRRSSIRPKAQLAHDRRCSKEAQVDLTRYQTLAKQNSIARQQAEDQAYRCAAGQGHRRSLIRPTSKPRTSTLALPGSSPPSTASSPIIKSMSARWSACPDRPRSQPSSRPTRSTSISRRASRKFWRFRRSSAEAGRPGQLDGPDPRLEHPGRDRPAG